MLKAEEKRLLKFTKQLSKLEPVDFIGVARFFNIPLTTEEKEPRDAADLLDDILEKFINLTSKKQKMFMKILKRGIK